MTREQVIKEITERMDWTVEDIEKIADWHLAEVARIVEPLVELSKIEYNQNTWDSDIARACAETIKRASGANREAEKKG